MRYEFPLAERELTRSGRKLHTYALRCLIAALLFVVIMLQADTYALDRVGRVLSEAVFLFQWVTVILVAPTVSVGLIAQERHDRTLSLLLTADFRGWDVFLAKWLRAVLEVFLLVLTPLPILAFAAFFGGVEVEVMVIRVVLCLIASATVCTLGLLASAQAGRPADALFLGVFYGALWLGPTLYLDMNATFTSQTNILFAGVDPFNGNWIVSALIALAIIPIAAALAVWRIPHLADDAPDTMRRAYDLRIERWAAIGPVARLVAAGTPGLAATVRVPFARVFAAIALSGLAFVPCAGDLLFMLIFFYAIITAINHMADSGALEDLLTTPTDRRDIAMALVRGNAARAWIFFPGTVLVGVPKILASISLSEQPGGVSSLLAFVLVVGVGLAYLSSFTFQFYAWVTFASAVGVQPGKPALQSLFALGIISFLYLVVSSMWLVAVGSTGVNPVNFGWILMHLSLLVVLSGLNVFVLLVSRSVVIDWVEQAAFLSRAQGYAG